MSGITRFWPALRAGLPLRSSRRESPSPRAVCGLLRSSGGRQRGNASSARSIRELDNGDHEGIRLRHPVRREGVGHDEPLAFNNFQPDARIVMPLSVRAVHHREELAARPQVTTNLRHEPRLGAEPLLEQLWFRPAAPELHARRIKGTLKPQLQCRVMTSILLQDERPGKSFEDIRLPSNGIGFFSGFIRGSVLIISSMRPKAASRVALSGHSIQEKTTVSSSLAFTDPRKSVTFPSGTSSPRIPGCG